MMMVGVGHVKRHRQMQGQMNVASLRVHVGIIAIVHGSRMNVAGVVRYLEKRDDKFHFEFIWAESDKN